METVERFGYMMSMAQASLLFEMLSDDILERYNNEEYWEPEMIEDFIKENKLKKV